MAETMLGTAPADTPTNDPAPTTTPEPTPTPAGGIPDGKQADTAPADAPKGDASPAAAGEPAPVKDAPLSDAKLPDWSEMRVKLAGGDDKILKRLSRYATLDDAIKGGIEAQNKLGAIKAVNPITKDSTPEEVAAYREAHGIPETAEGYEINLPDGMALGDYDKPVADSFLKIAHEHNIPAAAANAIIANQLALQNQAVQEQATADATALAEAKKELQSPEVWGREAELNLNIINSFLDSAPEGLKAQLENARLPNGKLLGNDVDALRWLASTAREMNPLATITPASGHTTADSVAEEKASLEKMMGDHSSDYWKGPRSETLQARYRDLAEASEKLKKRG